MDWKPAIASERAVLERIVALLFALADLAELAASQSPAIRALALWLLRHGAAAARKLVSDESDTSLASAPVVPAGGDPVDAMRLAASLRALARQIDVQARLASTTRCPCCDETDPQAAGPARAMRDAPHALSTLAALAWHAPHLAHAPDTS